MIPCYLIDISKDGNRRVGGKRVLAFHKQVTSVAGLSLAVAVADIRDSCLVTGVDLRCLRSHPPLPLCIEIVAESS